VGLCGWFFRPRALSAHVGSPATKSQKSCGYAGAPKKSRRCLAVCCKGQTISTDKRPLRHLARFVLIGLYTITRAAAIASAFPRRGTDHSYVDLKRGIYCRLPEGRRETNKRQPPIPVPPRRRWKEKGIAGTHFVEFGGEAVKSVKTAFKRAVQLPGREGKITPHTLQPTAATWLMQAGVDKWEAAGFLGHEC
jgi:hypothetical protein